MELIILTNISIILSLCLILIFINKLEEEKELSLKTIIVTIIILFIVNCAYYLVEHKSSFLFHLNIFIIVAYIILIITGLFLAISKSKTSYLKYILFGILFLIVPVYAIMMMAVGAMPI